MGGFFGALARYGLSALVHRYAPQSFPFGTLVVNVLGCLIIGVLMALIEQRQWFAPNLRLFLLVGLLGSFTTFSTLGYETFALLEQGALRLGLYNVAMNLTLGLGAVVSGRYAVKLLLA
jgi:CrcB protein